MLPPALIAPALGSAIAEDSSTSPLALSRAPPNFAEVMRIDSSAVNEIGPPAVNSTVT